MRRSNFKFLVLSFKWEEFEDEDEKEDEDDGWQ